MEPKTPPENESESEIELIPLPAESAPNVEISDLVGKESALSLANTEIQAIDKKPKWNHLTGKVEQSYTNPARFDEQYRLFSSTGQALDPTTGALVTSSSKQNTDLLEGKSAKALKREIKRKRQKADDPSQGNYLGPWATYEGPQAEAEEKVELTEEQKGILKKLEEKRQKKIEELKDEESRPITVQAKSVFHGNLARDYQGRSFLEPPLDQKLGPHQCYIPKKCIHTWVGHSKGVQCVRIFPKYGHYILSGSYDTQIKLWDVMTNKKCIQTYMGHTEAVRDLCFANDGKTFLSASFDKNVILWDTEYGKVIRAFTNRKIPYCVKFHPEDSKQNTFMVGSQAKKIVQYDINSGEVALQYEEHTGSVNTITFLDNNRKFVSTGDDKKIYLWEFGIPVVVKHISEPDMHVVATAAAHPNLKYMAGQSMDNKILVYEVKGTFRMNRKKKFTGHQNAGYAVNLGFSPDGKFLVSGDVGGKMWFWDWKTGRTYKTMSAHDAVCIDVQWHPVYPSRLISSSWDGTIKMWDQQ
eukprot:TRINITY_DN135128_c2_g1_i1.p2 TRINITY_DN135128_c2_g1~~TRINITY_DN135128_c2_g1_i1.p2  ORF type:complete len:559 (-),score=62.19 TRINITY_DN135128_c2_g1_i1:2638-4215(-)